MGQSRWEPPVGPAQPPAGWEGPGAPQPVGPPHLIRTEVWTVPTHPGVERVPAGSLERVPHPIYPVRRNFPGEGSPAPNRDWSIPVRSPRGLYGPMTSVPPPMMPTPGSLQMTPPLAPARLTEAAPKTVTEGTQTSGSLFASREVSAGSGRTAGSPLVPPTMTSTAA